MPIDNDVFTAAESLVPASWVAIDDVNCDCSILPNHRLQLDFVDTKVLHLSQHYDTTIILILMYSVTQLRHRIRLSSLLNVKLMRIKLYCSFLVEHVH